MLLVQRAVQGRKHQADIPCLLDGSERLPQIFQGDRKKFVVIVVGFCSDS